MIMSKMAWETPILEDLDVKMTLAGPGLTIPDATQHDPDEPDTVHYS